MCLLLPSPLELVCWLWHVRETRGVRNIVGSVVLLCIKQCVADFDNFCYLDLDLQSYKWLRCIAVATTARKQVQDMVSLVLCMAPLMSVFATIFPRLEVTHRV